MDQGQPAGMSRAMARPERTLGGGQQHYDDKESRRYTSTPQTIRIQTELTARALVLLGPEKVNLSPLSQDLTNNIFQVIHLHD